ncbi:MAG TPA: hypothetical protein VG099_32430 [Gemmataceae bacterium]|nr:hypothetical protein [Gemmataceae bacterium]
MTGDGLENGTSGFSKPSVRIDPLAFQRALLPYYLVFMAILIILPTIGQALMPYLQGHVSETEILELPLYDTAGPVSLGWLAVGPVAVGLVSFGGLAVGGIAMGGGAVGIVAIGGGAVGLLAVGGGAIGVIAVGGGALGYVAVGGGAVGRYALGGGAAGKYLLTGTRQDEEAIRFFCKYLPRLRQAFISVEGDSPSNIC